MPDPKITRLPYETRRERRQKTVCPKPQTHSAGSFPLHASLNLLIPTCASTLPDAEGLKRRRRDDITSKRLELILMPQLLSGLVPVAANVPQRL